MPLTPLHLAAGLPVRRWISLKAFILVNLMIDIEPAVVLFFNMDNLGYPIHGWSHSVCRRAFKSTQRCALNFTQGL